MTMSFRKELKSGLFNHRLTFHFLAQQPMMILSNLEEKLFPDESSPLDTFCLCDSSGTMFKVEDRSIWVLSEFVQNSGQPPSKIRLYVTWRPMVRRSCPIILH